MKAINPVWARAVSPIIAINNIIIGNM